MIPVSGTPRHLEVAVPDPVLRQAPRAGAGTRPDAATCVTNAREMPVL